MPETMVAGGLLGVDEPAPVLIRNAQGASPFLVTVDHAGRRIPRTLGTLGLEAARIERHIGWDIGILAVSEAMSACMDAPLIAQIYSRLVIDCNRQPGRPSSIPEISETDVIPGNIGLSPDDRALREATFLVPYQAAIADALEARLSAGRPVVLLAMHSFTPHYKNEARPMAAAVMWGRDDRFGRLVLEEMRRLRPDDLIAENLPYAVDPESDYTVPMQAERRGVAYLAVEIRQDLISDAQGIAQWAAVMVCAVERAGARFLSGAA